MNQKITKLVRQALKECVSTPVESVIAGSIDGHGIVEIPNSFAEKFAELIVRECLDVCKSETMVRYAAEVCASRIKEHFGVNE
jgi:hypothetical protein